MPSRPPSSSSSADRHTYIPPAAQAAMSQQMQSVPAHLRQYVGSDRPAFIPPNVQNELTNFMQKSAPAHLKQYAGAYVEQNVAAPTVSPTPLMRQPAIVDRLNQSHSGNITTEQSNAQFYGHLFQSDASAPQSSQATVSQTDPSTQQPPAPAGVPNPNYAFFLNPEQQKGPRLFNFSGNSLVARLVAIFGGILLLFIIFTVVKGALTGGDTAVPDLVSIVQDQQALIQVATDGTQNASADSLKNFAYTAQLSLSSEQSQLVAYLKQSDGRKVSSKEVGLKVSKTVQAQLASALASSSYDTTFKTTVQSELTAYQQDLKKTYAQEKGPRGRSLLKDDYTAADLLIKQLGS